MGVGLRRGGIWLDEWYRVDSLGVRVRWRGRRGLILLNSKASNTVTKSL